MVALLENSLPLFWTRWKVMLATSDQAANARTLAAIWVALNCEKPDVSVGMVVTESRKA